MTEAPARDAAGQAAELLRQSPGVEFTRLLREPLFWGWGARRGDGRDVLVLPGLGGSDLYLRTLRHWLRRVGYNPLPSGLERNPGWSPELVARFGELLTQRQAATGRRASIIGHSMGGVVGRSVAKAYPATVDLVVTLGSPLAMGTGELPPGVRLAAITARGDRVVSARASRARDQGAGNIVVEGGHLGLVFNVEVYRHLDRLLAGAAPRFV